MRTGCTALLSVLLVLSLPVLVFAAPLRATVTQADGDGGERGRRLLVGNLREAVRSSKALRYVKVGVGQVDVVFSATVRRVKPTRDRRYRVTVWVSESVDGDILGSARMTTRGSPNLSPRQARGLVERALQDYQANRRRTGSRTQASRGQGPDDEEESEEESEEGSDRNSVEPSEPDENLTGSGEAGASTADSEWDAASELAFADINEESDEVTGAQEGTALAISALLLMEHYRYFREPADDSMIAPLGEPEAGRDSIDLSMRFKGKASNGVAIGEVSLRRDFASPERNRIAVIEGYARTSSENFSLSAGFLRVSWGTATLWNPADIVNSRDLRDPLVEEKLGAWMARVGGIFGSVLMEAYYLPIPEVHLLPTPVAISPEGALLGTSRWVSGTVEPLAPGVPTQYDFAAPEFAVPTLGNSQGALRMARSAPALDFAVSYAYIFDRWPVIRPVVISAEPTQAVVQLQAESRRMHVVTAEAETTLGELRLATEAALFIPRASQNLDRTKFVQAVASVDRRISTGDGDGGVHIVLEVATNRAISEELDESPFRLLRFPFEYAALGRIRWDRDDLHLTVSGIADLRIYSVFAHPALEYDFNDILTGEIGLQLFRGSRERGFGVFTDNSRMLASLTAHY